MLVKNVYFKFLFIIFTIFIYQEAKVGGLLGDLIHKGHGAVLSVKHSSFQICQF